MSFVEPIALGAQAELERVAATTSLEDRLNGEAHFVERLQAGEAAAFDRLVSEQSSAIYALLYRLTEDMEEARDLAQETFLQAFRNIKHFRGDADLRTWLYRIAINQARNRWRWWRRRRRDQTLSLDTNDAAKDLQFTEGGGDKGGGNPEQQALARERERLLTEALRALKSSQREVVILRDVEGLSYEEVAAALGVGIGTVKSRLSRGRMELRRRLTGILNF